MRIALLFLACACSLPSQGKREVLAEDFMQLTLAEIERRLPDEHPSHYYLYAGRLWGAGKRDDAVFWFYTGQLRFRFHLLSNPSLERSGDPALFGSLQATIGEPINLYVGGDPKKWMKRIDEVLKWDAKTKNGFTAKTTHHKELEEVRAGLTKLRDYVEKNQEQIRAQREEQGIGEVGVVNGIYLEERKKKMPKDWPALQTTTSLAMLAGSYESSFEAGLGPILFFEDQSKVLSAKSVVLSAAGNDLLLIVAKRGDEELLSRTVKVRREKGSVLFDETRTASQRGLAEGGARETTFLRLNTAGELVIQRESITEGKYAGKPTPVRLSFTHWSRAKRLAASETPQP